MTFKQCCWMIASLGGAGILPLAAPADKPDSIRVLLVTGMDYPGHHWRETAPVVREDLAQDRRFEVKLLEDPYRLETADLSRFDVVLLHFMNWEKPEPNDRAKENLRGFVERGGGLVSIHFACGAFSNWSEYPKLLGKVWDGKTTHDPRGPFRVDIINTNHAITRGLGPAFETEDELYFCLTGTMPVEMLATAHSKVTKREEPMAFVHPYGKGRVFLTPLGHDVQALRAPGTAELLRRACAWTAGREPTARK